VFIASLPIVNAIIGVAFAGGIVTLLENSFTIPTVGPTLGTMLGLGVGVDYSLFILTRAYGELEEGHDPVDAMGRALSTAGRAVMFAGLTICMATIALVVVGIPLISQMGLIASLYVLIMVLAAITLVPALGGAAGTKLLDWRRGDPVPMNRPATSGLFAGLARVVTRHPVLVGAIALTVMLVLASPVRDLQTGWVGDDADPPDMTQKQAYDLLAHGFGPGVNGQLIVVVDTGPVPANEVVDAATTATDLQQALLADSGVETVSPPFPDTTPNPTAFAISVEPTTGPDDPATGDVVRSIRSQVIPDTLGSTDYEDGAHVGGLTATIIDLDAAIVDAMPQFMAAVLGGAFLLLLVVFRSILVGIKAVLMNLLTISATFGVLVAVFQWGWGSGLVGMHMDVDIISFVPLLVFAIVFGLSMDYEVFLMSRMQEEYFASSDPRDAVGRSLGTSGRVIVSAAFVMFAVFIAFVANPSPMVKQIGLGLAIGVFVDALIVRMFLVPALMRLFGRAGWWLPHWLDVILPNISIEGAPESTDAVDVGDPVEPAVPHA
jgi:RND superfamily putative drug exporter